MTTRELHHGDAEYPPRLRDLPRPPALVYVDGELPRGISVGIVGTRRSSPEGERFAFELARGASERGLVVLSGGAKGIDAAAHRGALAAGGATVVVSPSGVDRPFPARNAELFREIVAKGGAFLSAVPPGTVARRPLFFPRNWMLAALAHAVVVVESHLRGGARNAAKATRLLGRPLLVVPGSPWQPASAGCLQELRWGARLATSVDDVLAAVGLGGIPVQRELFPSDAPPGGPVEAHGFAIAFGPAGDRDERARVLELLELGPVHLDRLCAASGLPAARVQALILTLTLEGIVVSERPGCVALVNS